MHFPIKKVIVAVLVVFLLKIIVADPLMSKKNVAQNPDQLRRVPAAQATIAQ